MLPGMNDNFGVGLLTLRVVVPDCACNGRGLDELWAGPDDGDNLQAAAASTATSTIRS